LKEIPPAVDRLIESGKLEYKIRNFDLYTQDGRLMVDRIIAYERLEEEFQTVLEHLNMSNIPPLQRAKAGERDRTIPAGEVLSESQKKWIQETCKEEFSLLGYKA
jgi:hypothetical protein